jgi:Rieske Fe-S protein
MEFDEAALTESRSSRRVRKRREPLVTTDSHKDMRFARGFDLAHPPGKPPSPGVIAMSDTRTLVSRRQFCAGACQVASCATLATLATACGGDSPTSPGGGGASDLSVLRGNFANARVQVTMTGTPLATVGGAARVESTAGLFLVTRNSDTAFTVVDGTCTHEGCAITGATSTEYVCPCHGSRYTKSGQVTNGPARSSLRQYASTIANDVLTISV